MKIITRGQLAEFLEKMSTFRVNEYFEVDENGENEIHLQGNYEWQPFFAGYKFEIHKKSKCYDYLKNIFFKYNEIIEILKPKK